MNLFLRLPLLLTALSGLAGFASFAASPMQNADYCGADSHMELIGAPLDAVRGALPLGQLMRIEEPGKDYGAAGTSERLRILLDDERNIAALSCG